MLENERNIDFTNFAWESLYEVVDNEYFLNNDSALIYKALSKRLKLVPFGDYLKRYIYHKAGLKGAFQDIPLKEYQQIIRDSFADHSTPESFEPTTARLSSLSRNWLTQQTVKRKVVFLLGFGLSMSVEDVNDFLTKALRERGINAKDPFEVICWYCFKNRYGFSRYEKLWGAYNNTDPNSMDAEWIYSGMTMGFKNSASIIADDVTLIDFTSKLKTQENKTRLSVSARKCFDELYDKARVIIAGLYDQSEAEIHERELDLYRNRLMENDRLSEAEVRERILKKKAGLKTHDKNDITESDLEDIICSAVPVDRHGNLTPGNASKLNEQFTGKRFSRQHISYILNGKSEVNRFDIITLNFFIYSQTLDDYPNIKSRYASFVESTNSFLDRCSMGQIYVSNPYECFVLMCILSEDPLGTYADVWELSYQ